MKMKPIKPFYLFLLFLSIIIVVIGLLFTPDFIARHIKHIATLPPYTVTKVILYQLYSVIAGCFCL
jgi:hypothetical protein